MKTIQIAAAVSWPVTNRANTGLRHHSLTSPAQPNQSAERSTAVAATGEKLVIVRQEKQQK